MSKQSKANQRFVIISDSGESWALKGDAEFEDEQENEVLPGLLEQGWQVSTVTAGSGSKDDTSYWLVLLVRC